MGSGSGYGGSQTITEGQHTIRTVFTEAGMTYLFDGANVGTDSNSAAAIWGMSIKVADAMVIGASTSSSDGTQVTGTQSQALSPIAPNFNGSHKDFQLDSLVLRQIPTPAMLPFNVDSMNQKVSDAARYTSLVVEADNINTNKGMNIKVSIMQPPAKIGGTIEQEATTAYDGFENLDLGFIGGSGQVSLTDLPAAAITNGFMVRFHFYIPDHTQTDYHPIDWKRLPIVRNWKLNYDIAPTAGISCIGNTFNGDTTPPIDSKVGHVATFRGTGSTTDPDRTISQIQFNFGDGSESAWLDFTDKTLTSNTFDAAHVYTKAGSFDVYCKVKDDSGNESSPASAIAVVVVEAPPISILRATPALVVAGSAVKLDAASSYIVSSDPARTIATYTFNSGEGGSDVTQSGSTLNHTYNTAGEFIATMTCTDNASSPNTSTSSKQVIKVLAAGSTVDLLAQLNTRPHSFQRNESANLNAVPTLDGTYPEVTDTGQRQDNFTLKGSFLKATATTDITTMEGYLTNGTLVFIEWETTNWAGASSVQRFTGRMTNFQYEREGGKHGETPYSATFRREES